MSFMSRCSMLWLACVAAALPSIRCYASDAAVKIGYGWSVNPDEVKAVEEAAAMMRKTVAKPKLVILLTESSYEHDDVIAKTLSSQAPGAKIFGLESTYAVFTCDGVHVGKKGSLAILGVEAPSLAVGIGVTDMSDAETPTQIKEKAIKAIKQAVQDAGKTLEAKPSLILVAPAKQKEEPSLAAIEYVFGKNVKIVGGTPGGDNVTANGEVVKNGFVMAAIYGDTKIGTGFHAGIAFDKSKAGTVTSMGKSRRTIKTINNQPAFKVYQAWAEGALDDVKPESSPMIWSRSFALVRVYDIARDDVGTKVVVPIRVNPDLSLVTGADVNTGEKLYFATATRKAYIKRAGTIVQQAMVDGRIKYSELIGGVHFYCRGAAFSQFGKNKAKLQLLVDETNRRMKGKPFIGSFSAGEQGNIPGHGIFMGNLTSSMVVFGK